MINGSISDVKNLSFVCGEMIKEFNAVSGYEINLTDISDLERILSDKKTAKSVKAKQIAQLFECTPAEDKEQQKCGKAIITNLSKL